MLIRYLAIYLSLSLLSTLGADGAKENSEERLLLPIPPLLEGRVKELTINKGNLELPFGSSETLGYNGNYLGPTIKMRRGDVFKGLVNNTLSEDTTLHWHGMLVPAEFDGGPHQIIKAGSLWEPEFPIIQQASTLWYHPHLMGNTAEQVYRGLAGMFIIEDEYSDSLDIPKDYGVNDIPLILQERDINKAGSFTYRPSMPDLMHGYLGNVMLVNGAYKPFLETAPGTYRFRILNGSNSSLLQVKFSDDRDFTIIAGDGGFLPESVITNSLIISPGERYEILVDFKADSEQKLLSGVYQGNLYEVLTILTNKSKPDFMDHPLNFKSEDRENEVKGERTQYFRMETGGMGRFTINGKTMDMNRTDFTVEKDKTEIWTVENIAMGMMNVPTPFMSMMFNLKFSP
jgi:blue copper oxidase